MATFKPDKNFEKNLQKAIQPQLDRIAREKNAELQRKVAAVKRTHAGRPQAEVLTALEKAAKSVGVEKPNRTELGRLAKEISDS